MESDRGAEPATLAPPVSLAKKIIEKTSGPASSVSRLIAFDYAETEVTRGQAPSLILPDDECDAGAMAAIDTTFQQKLAGIRRLPKHERPYARRAAKDERASALRALRDRRSATRQFRRYLLRLRGLVP
jgi:hypothetical protein